jgi:hypothetical protein
MNGLHKSMKGCRLHKDMVWFVVKEEPLAILWDKRLNRRKGKWEKSKHTCRLEKYSI